jgi:phospholipid-translocating ATPase
MASGAGDDQDISLEDVWENTEDEIQLLEGVNFSAGNTQKPSIKGFSFEDSRLMQGNWTKEPNSSMVLLFFRILALCHTAIPEVNEETGALTYEAESPDEGAFLVAAREFGFEFSKRTQSSIFIKEKYTSSNGTTERLDLYFILHLSLAFIYFFDSESLAFFITFYSFIFIFDWDFLGNSRFSIYWNSIAKESE